MSNSHFQENQLDYRSSQTPVIRKTGDTNGRRQFGQVDRVVDLLCEGSSSSPQTGFYLHSPDFKSSPTQEETTLEVRALSHKIRQAIILKVNSKSRRAIAMEWKSAEQPSRPSWFSISIQPHQIIAEFSFTCFISSCNNI